jgi:hypothetical protein
MTETLLEEQLNRKSLYRGAASLSSPSEVQVSPGRIQRHGRISYLRKAGKGRFYNFGGFRHHARQWTLRYGDDAFGATTTYRYRKDFRKVNNAGIVREPRNSFLVRARKLEAHGNPDEALDLVYDQVDAMLSAGKLEELQEILTNVDPRLLSTSLILALLTSTLPVRKRLARRDGFFRLAAEHLKRRKDWTDDLLIGLE